MAELDEIKIVIRSILISSNRRMCAEDLRREYRDLEGNDCPFSALGYRNWVSFLQSIPDTLKVLPGELVVPVVTAETEHVHRLVALQKKPKSKARRRPSAYGSSKFYPKYRSSSYQSAPSWNRPAPSYAQSHSAFAYSNNIDDHFRKAREAKEEIRRQDLAVSSASSSRHGYDSCNQERGKEGPTIMSAQRNICPSSPRKMTPLPGWSGEEFLRSWEEAHHNCGDDLESKRIKFVPERESSDDSDDSFYDRFKEEEDSEGYEVDPKNINTKSKVHKVSEFDKFLDSGKINDKLKNNIRTLLKSCPNGLWACVLPEEYEKKFGVSLNWSELGYDSVVQMAHDLPDLIICQRVKSGDWRLFDASLPMSKRSCDDDDDSQRVPTVSDSLKIKIYNIVKKYQSGVRAIQLVQLFEEFYNKSLISEAPGFKDVESLLFSIQDTVIHLRFIRKECYVYPGEQPVESPALDAVKVDIGTNINQELYPEEALGPGDSYPRPQLPKDLKPLEYLELRVAEIYNPHNFFIMVREPSIKLDQLMDELQDFYRDHGDKYIMAPSSTIIPGLCCAAIYEGEWHRAYIKSVGAMVEVFYVDYGTVSKVPPEELRFIHRDFCSLPAQAIRASMCGIKPPDGLSRFTKEANKAFLELVLEKHLIGLVQTVDFEVPFLELFLIDTNGEKDLHLNDILVNNNHATFVGEEDELGEEKEIELGEGKESELGEEKGSKPALEQSIISSSCTQTTGAPAQTSTSQIDINNLSDSVSMNLAPSPAAFNQACNVTPSSVLPPPGFLASCTSSNLNNLNYSGGVGTCAPGVYSNYASYYANLLLLQQQQQQQALYLAYYQQYYQHQQQQQSAAAAAAALQASSFKIPNPQNAVPPLTNLNASLNANSNDNLLKTNLAFENKISHENNSRLVHDLVVKDTVLKGDVDSSDLSNTSDHDVSHKRKVLKKKRSEKLSPVSHNLTSSIKPVSRNAPYSLLNSPRGEGGSTIKGVVFSADESSVETPPSEACYSQAPDLVQSIAVLSLSGPTNFWKVIEINSQPVHLFNIDKKAYFSTGELALKFSEFSTCDTLVRVLKSKEIIVPFKKLRRAENLPLFSALDSCSDDMIKGLDLSRNKNGCVMNLHLTPITNIPSMLINLGTDTSIVKEFQVLRDSFNPNDKYWMT